MQVTGTFLFYALAIDSTMLPFLSTIASEQNYPIKNTMKRVKNFLQYAASQEKAFITFSTSDMVLTIHYDASCLTKNNTRIRAGGRPFISSDYEYPSRNGDVLNLSTIIRNVISSLAEA